MSSVDPIRPNGQNVPHPAQAGAEGVRTAYERNKGGGGGKDRDKDKDKEQGDGEEGDDAHLDADVFARSRGGNDLNELFSDKLPWEMEEENRRKRLDDMRQSRLQMGGQGTGMLRGTSSLAGGPTPGPARGTGALMPPPGGLPGTPKPQAPSSGLMGRQVEVGFDTNAAVNSTLAAHQVMMQRQAERDALRQAKEQAAAAPPPPAGRGTGALQFPPGSLLGRQQATPPPTPAPTDEPDLDQLDLTPAWLKIEQAPATRPGAQPVAPQEPPAQPALPERRNTGSLPPLPRKPFPPAPEPRTPFPPAPTPRPIDRARTGALPPLPPERPKPVEAPAPERKPAAVVPPLPPPAPMPIDDVARPIVTPGYNTAAFAYRVLDAGTGQPLPGARVELEPTVDDMLPVLNGQTDMQGWWASSNVPPGEYRVTIRFPGYIPHEKVRQLVAGTVDETYIGLAQP